MSEPEEKSRFDPIAVIESCYALERTTQSWLDELAKHARASLGGFVGIAGKLELEHGRNFPGAVGVSGGYPEARARELVRRSMPGAPGPGMERVVAHARAAAATRSSPVWSLSQAMAPLGSSARRPLEDPDAHELTVRDTLNVQASDGSIYLMGLHDRRVAPTTAQQRTWARLVPHIDAGARLREALATDDEEAVLTPDGRCLQASGPARSTSARDLLRSAAQRIDRARGSLRRSDPDGALDLWTALVAGRWSLVDRFESDGRRLVVAVRNPPSVTDPRALTERERQIVHLAAEGASNKIVAYTLGLTESGVGTQLGRALRKLGLSRREELAPAMRAVVTEAQIASTELAIASSTLRIDDEGLSPAEREIVAGVLRGLSNREIAIERGTSERTVANQLGAIFRKRGVSSRAELIARSS